MSRFYTAEECRRKADQHWEMAGLARQDRDTPDEKRHTQLARKWEQRASEGGWKSKQPLLRSSGSLLDELESKFPDVKAANSLHWDFQKLCEKYKIMLK